MTRDREFPRCCQTHRLFQLQGSLSAPAVAASPPPPAETAVLHSDYRTISSGGLRILFHFHISPELTLGAENTGVLGSHTTFFPSGPPFLTPLAHLSHFSDAHPVESMATRQASSGTGQLTVMMWNLWVLCPLAFVCVNGGNPNWGFISVLCTLSLDPFLLLPAPTPFSTDPQRRGLSPFARPRGP